MSTLVLQGFLLGWSVAWPPGPINAEMLRRGLARGFRSAFAVLIGACAGDFAWAFFVALGAGAVADRADVRLALGIVSLALLLLLAAVFLRSARASLARSRAGSGPPRPRPLDGERGGLLVGLILSITSPWNLAFWLAVMGHGSATGEIPSISSALVLAAAVLSGAFAWGLVFCGALHFGARLATPRWEVGSQALTGLLMLGFAAHLAWRLVSAA